MSHPRPVSWADLAAGRLSPQASAALEAHAIACASCRGTRARVGEARATLQVLAAAPVPPLRDDLLLARSYWSASSELRRRVRDGRGASTRWTRRLVPIALAVGVVAASVILYLEARPPAAQPAVVARELPLPPSPPPAPAPAPLAGVVTFLQGEVTLDGRPLSPDAEIGAGARLATGAGGRVAVQFGDQTGFVLEPGASLELARFDARDVELRVRGVIDVSVEKRAADQRFVVLAGGRTVEVRGTVFRVAERGGEVDVLVAHGRVAVDARVEVPAGSRLEAAAAAPRRLTAAEHATVARDLHVPTLAGWTSAGAARARSAVLLVEAGPRARVVVDGVELGVGGFLLRAEPGRVLVEAEGRSRWVEAGPGKTVSATLTSTAVERTSERPAQVDAQLRARRGLIARCGAAARKADPGVERGFLEVEIGVEIDGSIGFVAPVASEGAGDADTRAQIEDCVLGAIRDHFTFPAGSKSTVRKKIIF